MFRPFPFKLAAGAILVSTSADLPEYLLLGQINNSEQDVCDWLRKEFTAWTTRYGKCQGGSKQGWTGAKPDELPSGHQSLHRASEEELREEFKTRLSQDETTKALLEEFVRRDPKKFLADVIF